MNFLNNMKVSKKITLLVAVLLAFIAIITVVGIKSTDNLNKECDNLYYQELISMDHIAEANITLLGAERSIRNMVIAPSTEVSTIQTHKTNYAKNIEATSLNIEKAKSATKDEKLISDLAKLSIDIKNMVSVQEKVIMLVDAKADMETMRKALGESRATVNTVDVMMTTLKAESAKNAKNRLEITDAIYYQAIIINCAAGAIALLLGLILGAMIIKAIAKPLSTVSEKAALVAGGDLEQHFKIARTDEIGDLASSLESMVENLRARIQESEYKTEEAAQQSRNATAAMQEAQVAKDKAEAGSVAILKAAEHIEQVVNRLSAATQQLSAQIEQSSRSAETQRDRVTTSATAMSQMSSTVIEVARNAGVAADGSEQAKAKALHGSTIVQQSVAAITDVQNETSKLKTNMEELGKQAESIGMVMTMISDIADQTNLLALNAAIEAARAGEAGRGFAVVADEVRKLAEKTMSATKEVGTAISGIQNGAKLSIEGVTNSATKLDNTTILVNQSGQSLADIVEQAVATADQVRNIAAAAEEQSAASEEISASIDEINRIAMETATVMHQSSEAVNELACQADELQKLVLELRK